MKIGFIGGTVGTKEVTRYMLATAYMISCMQKGSIFALQTMFRNDSDKLEAAFERKDAGNCMREELRYYSVGGMDYLLQKYQVGQMTKDTVKMSARTIVPERFFCLSAEPEPLQESMMRCKTDCFQKIVEQAKMIADFVLIDGGRLENGLMSNDQRELFSEVDLMVILLSQNSELLETYFFQRQLLYENVVYFVCDYDENSPYNCKNMERIYRISKEQLVAVTSCQPFELAYEKGCTKEFIERHLFLGIYDRNYYFIKSLRHAVEIMLRAVQLTCWKEDYGECYG